MLVPNRAPILVVTGIRRAGLNLLADMLRAGNIPADRIATVVDPQNAPLDLPTSHCLGLFVDRTSVKLLASIERENGQEGRAPLSLFERTTLKRRLVRDLRAARERAAALFAPLYVFEFEKIVHDPASQAARLALILRDQYPQFDATPAALAVRRIHHERPPLVVKGTFRIVKP